MEYISSDTCVWIDFFEIRREHLPFLLPYTYIMCQDTIDQELLYPDAAGKKLMNLGLIGVDFTEEEFFLAEKYGYSYPKLSVCDRLALAIAEKRGLTLLTADGALRKAAQKEGVQYIGTLGILDRLFTDKYIDLAEYVYCLEELLRLNGGVVRLPPNELLSRLMRVVKNYESTI